MKLAPLLFVTCVALCTGSASSDTIQLLADRDNTLVEDEQGSLSMGKSFHFYAGRVGSNGEGTRRRALVRFDVAAAVPAGSTITSAALTLRMAQSNTGTQSIQLRRVLSDWGEGASFGFGGSGAPAAPGDATWLHRFWPGDPWQTPGGSFSAVVSAVRAVGGVGFYTWNSTASTVQDVQLWLDQPAQNFGWLLLGNESALKTVKKFDSRDTDVPAYAPVLTVSFVPPPPCLPADQDCDGAVGGADLGILLAKWGTADAKADISGDGMVDGQDLGLMLAAWTG